MRSTATRFTPLCCMAGVTLLLAACAGALPLAQDRIAADIEDRAYWALELGRSDRSVSAYESILTDYALYQDLTSVKFHLVRAYLDTGRFAAMHALADSIIEESPGSTVAAWCEFMKGESYLRQGDRIGAAEQYAAISRYTHLRNLDPVIAAYEKQGAILAQLAGEVTTDPSPRRPPAPQSTPERETQAGGIYDQAVSVLNSQVHLEDTVAAMASLGRIVTDFADTSYLGPAKLALVQGHLNCRQNQRAVDAALEVIRDYPGTTRAAWAQLFIGEAYRNMYQLLNAYYAFRDVELYASLPDLGPVVTARTKAQEMWGDLCREYPELKSAGWPVEGRTLGIADLAMLNGYDRDDPAECAWVGACWMASISPNLTLRLYDEMAASYPDEHFYLGLAAVTAADRFLSWARRQSDPENWEQAKAQAVSLLEYTRFATTEFPQIQVRADLCLARVYSREHKWSDVVGVAQQGLGTLPTPLCRNELSCLLGQAYSQLGRHQDAISAYQAVTQEGTYTGWMWPAMAGIANSLLRQGQPSQAADQFLAITAMSNNSSWRMLAAEEAAKCRVAAGDKLGAIQALQLAADELRHEMTADSAHLQPDIWPRYAATRLKILEGQISLLRSEMEGKVVQ